MAERFRFRPRYRALALGATAFGLAVAVLGAVHGPGGFAVAGGVLALLGVAYLASPTWRYVVVVDDEALEVSRDDERRFRLPWAGVVKVIASPSTQTCFVDGGVPERSLLVPGVGAPAPYALERRADLYRAILARVPAERVREVPSLDAATA